ncbi:MAG: hypothetical protein H3Z52_16190, partial [archaeon]|nr:hypothetical protein [archaeon]
MEDSFDSTYIIRKERYKEFMADVEKLALNAYTIPAFIWPELYKMINMEKDIAMRVVWKPGTTVKQIKD